MHEQTGLWLITLQLEFCPHGSGQGFEHFCCMHALLVAHSEFVTHSGLHPGGEPVYVGRHEQIAWWFISRHWLFGPHGVGMQGFVGSISVSIKKKN